jgi:signal transduction histidine kinase/ActR/RegA family two-component response regulator
MAEEATGGDALASDPAVWTGRWVSAVALVAAIILMALIFFVTLTNRDRESALALERNTYEVMQLARAVDNSISRAEASMGRYVLDETQASATQFYNEWRIAARQIQQLGQLVAADRAQTEHVRELQRLFGARSEELGLVARVIQEREGNRGIALFYTINRSPLLGSIRAQLDEIVRAGRQTLGERVRTTQDAAASAERLTRWLAWVAILISLLAVALSYWAYRAFAEGQVARSEAESEAWRASELERAVQARTAELVEANAQLQTEIGERAAAEEKLRQVQKMEAVGQLTGGIAHDFNNMLAVIVGGIDLAKRKLRGPRRDVEFHLDSAMEGATRAAALTRRLLAFARSEPLLPQAIAPGELVKGMLELIDRSLGERITVETRFPREPWRVWADTNQLENAVLNLCVNARDAMNGEGQLGIWVDNVSLYQSQVGELAAGDYVRISIADTGTGIAPEHLERVFEPFFTTKPVGKGTGLGLSQIFGFARQSGGDVAIDSTVGVGTTVSLYLPRSLRAPEIGAERGGPMLEHVEGLPPASANATILVVEDDPRVSRATVGSLEELGYVPIACASGREALNIIGLHPEIDLVITDVMMPEMTGPELVRIIAERHPDVSVLFVTGFVGEAGEAEDLAGYELLRKPFTVSALANAVHAVLARRAGLSGSRPAPTSEAAE